MKVTALVDASDADFIAAVSKALDAPIALATSAPADGYLLVSQASSLEITAEVAPRVFWLRADRNGLTAWLEQHGFAGAVVSYRFEMWLKRGATVEPSWGVVGRTALATAMDATILARPFTPTEHYGLFDSSRYPDLPTWVAAYLRAYDADGGTAANKP